jgi:hypothetical protein
MASSGQLSLFAAGVSPAATDDLDGLLCGPAQIAWRGRGARLSVLVTDSWRVRALLEELTVRHLTPEAVPGASERGATSVRTGFDGRLLPLAGRWTGSAGKQAPPELRLDGTRLRLWLIAAGSPAAAPGPDGWQLALGPHDAEVWLPVGAALAAAGLPGALVGPRVSGPAYRLTGARRLARLAEMVGQPPPGCPPQDWPA